MAGWIPFRAPSVRDAFLLCFRMVDPRQFLNLSLSADSYALAAFLTPATMLVYLVRQAAPRLVGSSPFAAGAAQTVLIAILFAGDVLCLDVRSQFIYFQF
jgi:hypothetical protein